MDKYVITAILIIVVVALVAAVDLYSVKVKQKMEMDWDGKCRRADPERDRKNSPVHITLPSTLGGRIPPRIVCSSESHDISIDFSNLSHRIYIQQVKGSSIRVNGKPIEEVLVRGGEKVNGTVEWHFEPKREHWSEMDVDELEMK